ncbi:MAG: dihydropteroate synthase [Pseudomonadota bacterium]
MSSRRNAVRALLDQQRPLIMGVLNVTPDSFSDGGRYASTDAAVMAAQRMLQAGADIIDVGGESTRPGAADVSLEQELERTIPVIDAIARDSEAVISIDTSKPRVMRDAVAAGASLINDVRALSEPNALETAGELEVPVCLMHMQGAPETMQASPHYADVVIEVREFLYDRILACQRAGISADRILVDPGFGFGKRLEDNLALVRGLDAIGNLGYPVLIGVSRKSMLGQITGRGVAHRQTASAILAAECVRRGARLVRVHDVESTVDALKILAAVSGEAWWESD